MCLWAVSMIILIAIPTMYARGAEPSSVIRTYSPACQTMFNHEIYQKLNMGTQCSQEGTSWLTQNLIKVGLCTENEINNLTATICGTGSSPTITLSPAKNSFYAALNTLSQNCQAKVLICLKQSAVSIVLKQQEQYCGLMSLKMNGYSSEECLNAEAPYCNNTEIRQLKSAACDVTTTDVDQTFSNALLKSSPSCQAQVSSCSASNQNATQLVQYGNYCQVIYLLENVSVADSCKTNNYCAAGEFEVLKKSACGAPKPTNSTSFKTSFLYEASQVIRTFSPACQTMFSQSIYQNMSTKTLCSQEGFSLVTQHLVKIGFCTENERNTLTAAVCGRSTNQQVTISQARSSFYATLNTLSYECQVKTHKCMKSSAILIVFKQQEQFCSLIQINIRGAPLETCLTNGSPSCTKAEFAQLKSAACNAIKTNVDQTFSNALLKTSQQCQSLISNCADSNENATQSVIFEKYCSALMINEKSDTKATQCKTTNYCTASEFDLLKTAACEPSKMLNSASFMSVCYMYVIFLSIMYLSFFL